MIFFSSTVSPLGDLFRKIDCCSSDERLYFFNCPQTWDRRSEVECVASNGSTRKVGFEPENLGSVIDDD